MSGVEHLVDQTRKTDSAAGVVSLLGNPSSFLLVRVSRPSPSRFFVIPAITTDVVYTPLGVVGLEKHSAD